MFQVIIILAVVGLLLWVLNTYLPIDGTIKKVINVVVLICVVFWLLQVFGVLGHAHDIPVPQLR
jgi:hypothetical protein